MSVAVLALMGVIIAALVPGAVALFKVQTVDRKSATVDQARALSEQIRGLWDENRLLGNELSKARADNDACRARISDLQIEVERLKWRVDNGK